MERLFKSRLSTVFAAAVLGLTSVWAPAPAHAEASEMCLHVKLRTGQVEEFVLSAQPVLTFSETECIITSPDCEVTHLMADVEQAYFGMSTSVTDMNSDSLSVDLSNPGHVIVRGIPTGTNVALYDLEGRRLAGAAADNDGTADGDMSALPGNTVYIVSISNINNFKICKR